MTVTTTTTMPMMMIEGILYNIYEQDTDRRITAVIEDIHYRNDVLVPEGICSAPKGDAATFPST